MSRRGRRGKRIVFSNGSRSNAVRRKQKEKAHLLTSGLAWQRRAAVSFVLEKIAPILMSGACGGSALLRPYRLGFRYWISARERKDLEIVFAWRDEGQESAIGRNGEFAKSQVVKQRHRCGLNNRGSLAGRHGRERREIDPHQFAGFSFGRALEEDAVLAGSPLIYAEADAYTRHAIGRSEVAHFQDFVVDVVRAEFPTR